jgi:hypothetical protein
MVSTRRTEQVCQARESTLLEQEEALCFLKQAAYWDY